MDELEALKFSRITFVFYHSRNHTNSSTKKIKLKFVIRY